RGGGRRPCGRTRQPASSPAKRFTLTADTTSWIRASRRYTATLELAWLRKIVFVKMDDLMAPKQAAGDTAKMKRKAYEQELRKLQVELCHLQDWVKDKGARIIVVFEGRDAAGTGGTINAISQ